MDIQVRDVTAFAQAQNLVLARVFEDKAESGVAEKRKQLNKLLRACERGDIDTVIIPSLDRLSRDVRIAENLFWKFDQLSVRVLIADMPMYDHTNRRDVLVRQIREAIAEDNRKEIIERLWKGRQERVRKGKVPGGTAPYGYMRVGKALRADATESQTVRIIFELASLGYSSAEVAQELQEEGRVRRNRTAWTPRQVRSVLARRELYASGVIRYGDARGTDEKLILIRKTDQVCDEDAEVGVSL